MKQDFLIYCPACQTMIQFGGPAKFRLICPECKATLIYKYARAYYEIERLREESKWQLTD